MRVTTIYDAMTEAEDKIFDNDMRLIQGLGTIIRNNQYASAATIQVLEQVQLLVSRTTEANGLVMTMHQKAKLQLIPYIGTEI